MGLIGVALSFGKCYSTSVIGETLGSPSVVYDVSLSPAGEGFGPAVAGITRSKESDWSSWIFIQGISGATQLVGAACIALVMRGEIWRAVLRLMRLMNGRRSQLGH